MRYIFIKILLNIYILKFYFVLTYENNYETLKHNNITQVLKLDKNETKNEFQNVNDTLNNSTRFENNTDNVLENKLNIVNMNNTVSAEEICSNKWKHINKGKSCCSSIVSIFETQKICNERLLFEISNKDKEIKNKELIEALNYYDLFCNNTDYMELVSNNITTEDIYNCMNFNIKTNSTLESKNNNDSTNNSKDERERNLQLSGWMNEFRLPVGSGPNLLAQSISTEGSFLLASGGPNCSPLLSLVFVRVCNSICNSHHDSSSGISSIPLFCMRDCRPFSKIACLRGCRKFGCSVDLYTCMELMCE